MKQIQLSRRHVADGVWLLLAAAASVQAQSPQAQPPAQVPSAQTAAPRPGPTTAPGADPAPAPSSDQTSYLFGLTFGSQMKSVGITNEVSVDAIARGIKDGLQGKQPSPAEQAQLQGYIRSIADAAVARNQQAAADFLARNTHDKNVVTTASGLQYKVLASGDKKAPAIMATDTVTVQYRGKLLDGTEFDSSYSRGVPATFPVNGVIKGWQEALVLMKPGAKWQLYVPPALGYGSSPKPKIPGGSLLMFDVELMSAESAGGAAAPPNAPPGTPPAPKKSH